MDDFNSDTPAAIWSRNLAFWAFVCLINCFVAAWAFSLEFLLLAGLILFFLLGTAGILVHLFGVAQIQMLEFILLASILGNVLGWTYHFTFNSMNESMAFKLIYFAIVSSAVIIVIVGATCKGLNLVRALKLRAPFKRLEVVALALLSPIAAVTAPIAAIGSILLFSEKEIVQGAMCLCVCAACLLILIRLHYLNTRAEFLSRSGSR